MWLEERDTDVTPKTLATDPEALVTQLPLALEEVDA